MGNDKNPGYEVIQDSERIKSIVENELKNFKKGFGIDVKTYEDINNIPDSVKMIIEQYYTSAILMIPNVSRNTGAPPYDEKCSGAVFENGRNVVFDRINRTQKGIDLLIELYQNLEKATDEEKSTIMTHIKLVETDLSNNLAHTYDDIKEPGSLDARSRINFKDNFNSNGHLVHKRNPMVSKEEDDYNQKTRQVAINKFIRNTLTNLNNSIGNSGISVLANLGNKGKEKVNTNNMNLNDFNITCTAGFRAGLLRQKDRGIKELISGNYEVTPIIATVPDQTGYSTDKLDQILFIGKKGNISVVNWHFGASKELSNSTEIRGITERYPLEEIKPLIDRGVSNRAMPNMEVIEHSIKRENTPFLDKKSTSLLDKLNEIKRLIVDRAKYKGDVSKQADYNAKIIELRSQIKFPDSMPNECDRLLKTLKLAELADKLKGVPSSKERQ